MAVSTALFAVATGASRLVGMLREAAAAWIFSVQGEAINAFTVAYQIPNLIRSLVADAALGAAFVPIFNELLTKGERERAWRVASTVWWLSFAGLSAVTGVAMVLAPQLLGLFGYHGALGVGLARVIFPTVVMLGLNGLQTAILNALDEFFLPAIAPVAWNIVIVGTLALGLPFLHTTDGASTRTRSASCSAPPSSLRSVSGHAPPRPPDLVLRSAGRGRAAGLRAHAAGHARPRADQPQPARQHVVRGGRRHPRPGGRGQGVPDLHAAAGHVLRGRGRSAVPGPLEARGGP